MRKVLIVGWTGKGSSAAAGFDFCGYQNAGDERSYDGAGDSGSGTGL